MNPGAAKADISSILAGEDFHSMLEIRIPEFDYEGLADSWIVEWIARWLSGIGGSSSNLSLVEILLWLLVFGLLLVFVVNFRSWLKRYLPRSHSQDVKQADRTAQLFGMDIRAESLPTDVVDVAQGLWAEGQHRAAVALLYRGSLSGLVDRFECRFREGDTERECLAEVAKLRDDSLYSGFSRLSQAWQCIAYGRISPSDKAFSTLCAEWLRHFQVGTQAGEEPAEDANSDSARRTRRNQR